MQIDRNQGRLGIEAGAVFAAYAVITVWWLWPLPLAAVTHLAYFLGEKRLVASDVYLLVWVLSWDAHALFTQPWSLFHANSFYPAPLSLAYSEHLLGYLPLFAPTYWLSGNPILATNVMIFLTYPLCGLGAYLLARRFVAGPAAAVAGLIYAFYPPRLLSLGHFHMLGVAYLPLALFFTERWLESARRKDALGLAACLALQLLSSFYLAYAAVVAYGAYLVLALVRWRDRLDRRRLIGLAIAAFAVAVPFGLTSVPYLILRRWGFIPSYGGEGDQAPLAMIPVLSAGYVYRYLASEGVAPAVYALGALALLPPWRGSAWPRILALALIAAGLTVSFGPTIHLGTWALPSPYRLLQDWLPGFAAVRMPSRFLVIAQLGFALLAALGMSRLLGWVRSWMAWPITAAASAGVLVSFASLPAVPLHAHPVGDEVPAVYRWLAENGDGRPLLELPPANFAQAARRMYLSNFHWLPIVEGYSGYVPDSPSYIHDLARDLPEPNALARLTDWVDVGWILVHRDLLGESMRSAWDAPPPGLEKVGEFGDDLLFRVTVPTGFDARARLFDADRTLDGVPLVPLTGECPGAIELLEPAQRIWESGRVVPIRVALENHGESAWPGHGFVPRHLVRASACLGLPGRPACLGDAQTLATDVHARGRVTVPLSVVTPSAWLGDYVLHVRLFQVGDGMLEDCGVQPLSVPVRIAARPKEPPGSYWQTCRDCRYDGTTLTCFCLDGKGGERELSTSEPCPKGYGNRFGELACEGSP